MKNRRPEDRLRTKIYDLADDYYLNLAELAKAMDISSSQVYRVHQRKRGINEKFIVGALAAFPGLSLNDLFYVERSK